MSSPDGFSVLIMQIYELRHRDSGLQKCTDSHQGRRQDCVWRKYEPVVTKLLRKDAGINGEEDMEFVLWHAKEHVVPSQCRCK